MILKLFVTLTNSTLKTVFELKHYFSFNLETSRDKKLSNTKKFIRYSTRPTLLFKSFGVSNFEVRISFKF